MVDKRRVGVMSLAGITMHGTRFSPPVCAYPGFAGASTGFTTAEDSGAVVVSVEQARMLAPIMAAAIHEAGFAIEFGPLSTARH